MKTHHLSISHSWTYSDARVRSLALLNSWLYCDCSKHVKRATKLVVGWSTDNIVNAVRSVA